MRREWGRRRILAAAPVLAVVATLQGCGDTVGPEPLPGGEGVSFTFTDGVAYQAAGDPVFDGGDIATDAFAIAFADSVGGLVVTSFRATQGTRGDLFILQLTRLEEGGFGPCGPGGDCHGRTLEDIDGADLHDVGAYWEVVAGEVTLDEAGPGRVRGTFGDVVLRAQGGTEPARTIGHGTFDLPLLADEEGVDIMRCFLTRATGGACGG